MKCTNNVIWANTRFGPKDNSEAVTSAGTAAPIALPGVNIWAFIGHLWSIRLSLNKLDYESARIRFEYLNRTCKNDLPIVLVGVLAELQVALAIHDGDFHQAIRLYEEQIIPAYDGFPKTLIKRATRSLDVVRDQIRKSA